MTSRLHDLLAALLIGCLSLAAAGCGGSVDASEPRPGGERAGGALDLGFPDERREREARVVRPPRDLAAARAPRVEEQRPVGQELRSAVEAAIAGAVTRARRASSGKVDGSNSVVAVHVRDLGTGRVLVDIQGDAALVPASNLKVLTVAAALELMGADAAFETPFIARGELRDGLLTGDLVVRAGGDPLYRRPEDVGEDDPGAVDWWMEEAARQLRESGVQRVSGRLVLDDSAWLEPGPAEGWPDSREHWKSYCALCAGFTANAGCLTATVTPRRAGEAALTVLRPRDIGISRRVEVRTGARRSGNDVRVGATATRATVRGSLAEDLPRVVSEFAHPDPIMLFGYSLLGALTRAGIQVDGGLARDAAPDGGVEVARVRTPISTAFVPVLLDSNNSVADQLFLATAHRVTGRGDREAGEGALVRALEQLQVDPDGLRVVDGSGLSKVNRIAPVQLTAILGALARSPGPGFDAFVGALPVAGRTSKLAARMDGTAAEGRVYAKTGFVSGASGLSGFADTRGGRRLAFSILVNYPRVSGINNAAWKPMQDEICAALVEHGDVPGPGAR